MAFWLKDYAALLERIEYEEFRLTDSYLNAEEREKSKALLAQSYERKEKFEQLISIFKGIEHKILIRKYVEGKTLEFIAEELHLSVSYISKKHADIMRRIQFAEQWGVKNEFSNHC